MNKIKKTKIYSSSKVKKFNFGLKSNYSSRHARTIITIALLVIVYYLLFILPVQSQAPKIGVTLTWSTDSYTPLNYQGKALPARSSNIEVVANIDSQEINPQDLVYAWFLDDSIQEADSGQGKQVFRFNIGARINRDRLVKVKIKDTAGVLIVSSSYLFIKAIESEIVIKTETPSLKSFNLIPKYQISANQEVTFTAQPYFFNIKDVGELDYKWSLAGKVASRITTDRPNIFTLKVGQLTESIKQDLVVWAENKNNPLQRSQITAEITLVP